MIDLSELNDVQREAVKAGDGPLLILAGAGSGKTRVLTYRVAYLVEQGVDPKNILAVTFTNKAANEMRNRVRELVGDQAKNIWAGTFHSICVRILRMYADEIGISRNFSIFDDTDSEKLIKKTIQRLGSTLDPKMTTNVISYMKVNLKGPSEVATALADSPVKDEVERIYTEYQNALALNNALDFDDLIMKTVELLTRSKKVRAVFQNRFKYILVDEYQDVNRAQYIFIKTLAEKNKNIFVVGDDYQSIYAFRGADITSILNFERDYPDAQVFKLEQNYRCSGRILTAANKVIENNSDQKAKELWTENPAGSKILVQKCFHDKDEGEFVATKIQELMKLHDWKYSDFAVLYRANFQSRSVEEALLHARIPYIVLGGLSFYQRKEIKDIIAYLKVICNPADSVSLRRIINVPKRGIGDSTIDRLDVYAGERNITLLEAARRVEEINEIKKRATNQVLAFVELYDKIIEYTKDNPVPDLVEFILENSGYADDLKSQGDEGSNRLENLAEFHSMVTGYFNTHENADLDSFMQEISLLSDVDDLDEDSDAVRLMTIHTAKGLEFPVVFLVGMEEGIFPHNRSLGSEKEIEEERRLCYVALTRAKRELILTYCETRMVYGETKEGEPSRFLYEIPKELIEEGAQFGAEKVENYDLW